MLAACSGVLTLTLLVGCAASGGAVRRTEVQACADKEAPACIAARSRFQQVRYPAFPEGRLVAAMSRALGDLNFEVTERNDAQGRVSGGYFASAPTHPGQSDEQFNKVLKPYTPAAVSARAEILPLPDGTGADVRLQLFAAGGEGAPVPIDSVPPYQLFFRQLGIELGAEPGPLKEVEPPDPRKRIAPPRF